MEDITIYILPELNERGMEIWEKWEQIYTQELERLREEKNDPEYTEGWCIIDSYEFAPDIEDEAQLLVWAYDGNVENYFSEWASDEHADQFYRNVHGEWFSLHELEKEVAQYLNDYEMVTKGE